MGNDDVGQRGVDGLALGVQPLERGAVGGQRAAVPWQRAQAVSSSTSIQITRWSASASRTAAEVTAPPPSANTRARARREQFERDPLLGRAEGGLAVLGEDLGDRLAQPLLDHGVDVDRVGPERSAGAGRRSSCPRP